MKVSSGNKVLLSYVKTIKLPPLEKTFLDGNFQERANIGLLGDNVKDFFSRQLEEDIPAIQLTIHRLEKDSTNKLILDELGPKPEISFAHFIGLIQNQAKGQEGLLLVNKYANVAYIRDKKGNLWPVYAYWVAVHGHWYVLAYPMKDKDEWSAGCHFLSRDSS